jgi:repressor LexA
MGVLDGDIVLIQHQFTAKNGDVVVGIVNGEATLKVFKRQGNKVILEARNPSFKPMILDSIDIRGKFVGLIRSS